MAENKLSEKILVVDNLCHQFTQSGKKNKPVRRKGLNHNHDHNDDHSHQVNSNDPTKNENNNDIVLFDNLSLTLKKGEAVALLGSSGSGKTTLLNLLGLMSPCQQGLIELNGRNTARLSEKARNRWRGRTIGFVFQHHYLVDELNALENTALPLWVLGYKKRAGLERASEVLIAVGLGHRLHHYPASLSGGERQRVALARALVHGPTLLLADEPTGNLDPHNADGVFQLLLHEIETRGMAAIIATHDWQRAKQLQKQYWIKNKKLILDKNTDKK